MEPGGGRRVVSQRRLDPEPEPNSEEPAAPAGPDNEQPAELTIVAARPPIDWSVPSGEALRARQRAWFKERARFEARSAGSKADPEEHA